jgi:hypothetical protein
MKERWEMKLVLGAILLLLVGCSGVVQAQGEDKDAQIAALTERVAELEDQVYDLAEWVGEFEHIRWTEDHAIGAVAYKVWERTSSCAVDTLSYQCYITDPVLRAFLTLTHEGQPVNGGFQKFIALSAFSYGQWTATPIGDGDSWEVSVTVPVQNQDGGITDYGPVSWTVRESNGYIQAAE